MWQKINLYFFLFVFVLPGGNLFSQKKEIQEADLLFTQKMYREASISYQKIYDKTKDRKMLLKLGDCSFSIENYLQAQKYYSEYFKDTIYENIPQYLNYAKSTKMNGNIPLVVKLNKQIYEKTEDPSAKKIYDTYRLYTDSLRFIQSYDLDSNYFCVYIYAGSYLDSVSTELFYLWDFGEGETKEGVIVNHCFPKFGNYNVVLNILDKQKDYTKKRDTTLIIRLEEQAVKFSSPKIGKRYFYLDFDASTINLPAYEVIEFIWDMDNGETTTGKKIKYKYNETGDYKVRLSLITQNIYTHQRKLFSAYRTISIKENYEMPSKKFSEDLDKSK